MVFVFLNWSACSGDKGREKPAEIITVRTVRANKTFFDNNLNSFGTILYKIKNDIVTQVEGTISVLPVKEGDIITVGQQIALLRNVQLEIQNEQYENNVDSAKASLEMAEARMYEARLNVESRLLNIEKSNFDLQQKLLELENEKNSLEGKAELHQIGGLTDSALKSLQLSVAAKEAEIAILKKDIEIAQLGLRDSDLIDGGYAISSNPEQKKRQFIELNTRTIAAEIETATVALKNAQNSLTSVRRLRDELNIRTNVAGVVGALYNERGEHLPQNTKIATIMDISSVYVVFYIQEQDIINFSLGTPLDIEIPSLKRNLKVKIDEISPIADPQSGNFSVKAEIKNENLQIRPGMFVKCTIPRVHDVMYIAIPETALVKSNASDGSVFCVNNGFALLKSVKIQAQKDGIVWITSGLDENEIVIDKPSPFLKEGERVNAE
ncbi:MAG: efflux RND transporter periplasmic adaptor subunit [Treponema sp.]|nr:efflux RND transporter periplasmic adaptor subunit [Treponema sp.]